MKKGLRNDSRKQTKIIRTHIASKLNKIPHLAGLAYQLAETSKDITINNIDSYLDSLNNLVEVDDFDKQLILSEYNRIIVQHEQTDKHTEH